MPLTPSTTDKFQKVGSPGTATTLNAPGYTHGASTSITVPSTTNWPTDTKTTFAMDRAQVVNGVEERIAGTYCEFEGIVTGANTVSDVVKKVGNDQDYAAGALTRVYIPVSSNRENQLVEGLNQDHNGKGNHKNLTDDNDNEWLERGSVANAKNHVKVTNAIAGSSAKIDAAGDDADANLEIGAKGSGLVKVQGAVPQKFFALYNFIESGCVWSGNGYGSTLLASMTAGVVWIGGKRLTVAAVISRTFTVSKDTYVDFQDNGDGTATIIYTEVANNAASPALPNSKTEPNNVRNAIIVTGATNIAGVGSINQGEETKVLPIASSVPYAVTDSLGNLISPRDPNRKVLGLRQLVSSYTADTAEAIVQITGLSLPITVPTGRKIKCTLQASNVKNTNASVGYTTLGIHEGTVGSGTYKTFAAKEASAVNKGDPMQAMVEYTPSSSNITLNASIKSAYASTLYGSSTVPIQLIVELV